MQAKNRLLLQGNYYLTYA